MARNRIFKYLLLFVVAFLGAAWIANFFGQVGIGTRWGKFDQHFTFRSGSLSIAQHNNGMLQGIFWRTYPRNVPEKYGGARNVSSLSARLRFTNHGDGHLDVEVPIILLITAMIPVVLGTFSRFRFRLWQLFVFTAILALELAFFLRK